MEWADGTVVVGGEDQASECMVVAIMLGAPGVKQAELSFENITRGSG